MDTFTESLSYDEQTFVLYDGTQTEQISSEDLVVDEQAEVYPFTPHPLVVADRSRALQTIQNALSAARALRFEFQSSLSAVPACPYQRTLTEYLGPNYICPSIHDLSLPSKFNPKEAVISIAKIDKKYNDLMFTHLQAITAEATNTGFPGITSQNLGNAFALLSTTANGEEYVIDKPKASKHLELAELIRNIPSEYIIQNPVEVAQKLVAQFIEIHED